jgi:DNA-directed RNA polymerase subunit N (RpoN/RPB10)
MPVPRLSLCLTNGAAWGSFWRKVKEGVRRPKVQDADVDDDLGIDRDILEVCARRATRAATMCRLGTRRAVTRVLWGCGGVGCGGVGAFVVQAPEIQDLVVQELEKNAVNLEVLGKEHLFQAVNQFVEKVRVRVAACLLSAAGHQPVRGKGARGSIYNIYRCVHVSPFSLSLARSLFLSLSLSLALSHTRALGNHLSRCIHTAWFCPDAKVGGCAGGAACY